MLRLTTFILISREFYCMKLIWFVGLNFFFSMTYLAVPNEIVEFDFRDFTFFCVCGRESVQI